MIKRKEGPQMSFVLDLLSEIVVCHQFISVAVPQCEIGCRVGNPEVDAKLTHDVLDSESGVNASTNGDAVFGRDIVGWNESSGGL